MNEDLSAFHANALSTQAGQEQLANILAEIATQIELGQALDWPQVYSRYPQFSQEFDEIRPAMDALGNFKVAAGSGDCVSPSFLGLNSSGTLGDFRIESELGRGGMGVVYAARQISIDRRVALKILPLAELIDERAIVRFKNEVTAIATLEHPNIVSVYSIGEERGIHYYAMQLVQGQSLAVVIRELQARASEQRNHHRRCNRRSGLGGIVKATRLFGHCLPSPSKR